MAKKKSTLQKVGGYSFLIGFLLAVIIGLIVGFGGATPSWAYGVLAVLGLVVGLLNISPEEVIAFLVSTVAFLLSFGALEALLSNLGSVGAGLAVFFGLLQVFVAPAAAVVAVFAIIGLIRD